MNAFRACQDYLRNAKTIEELDAFKEVMAKEIEELKNDAEPLWIKIIRQEWFYHRYYALPKKLGLPYNESPKMLSSNTGGNNTYYKRGYRRN